MKRLTVNPVGKMHEVNANSTDSRNGVVGVEVGVGTIGTLTGVGVGSHLSPHFEKGVGVGVCCC